jgi:hypothetical protein
MSFDLRPMREPIKELPDEPRRKKLHCGHPHESARESHKEPLWKAPMRTETMFKVPVTSATKSGKQNGGNHMAEQAKIVTGIGKAELHRILVRGYDLKRRWWARSPFTNMRV